MDFLTDQKQWICVRGIYSSYCDMTSSVLATGLIVASYIGANFVNIIAPYLQMKIIYGYFIAEWPAQYYEMVATKNKKLKLMDLTYVKCKCIAMSFGN